MSKDFYLIKAKDAWLWLIIFFCLLIVVSIYLINNDVRIGKLIDWKNGISYECVKNKTTIQPNNEHCSVKYLTHSDSILTCEIYDELSGKVINDSVEFNIPEGMVGIAVYDCLEGEPSYINETVCADWGLIVHS